MVEMVVIIINQSDCDKCFSWKRLTIANNRDGSIIPKLCLFIVIKWLEC